jgi:hypothetical protein
VFAWHQTAPLSIVLKIMHHLQNISSPSKGSIAEFFQEFIGLCLDQLGAP